MKKQMKKQMKKRDDNSILYLLIILLLLIVFVYHCNFSKNLNNSKVINEGFKSRYSEKHLAGEKIINLPNGNPLLPRNHQKIKIVGCQGDFNNNKLFKSQQEKLYLDNNSDGVVILPKGYIKIDLDKYEKIDSIVIKGLKKGRIDIDNKKQNEFKHLFDINTQFCNELVQYNKLNINQLNHIAPSSDIKMKSLKITNTSNKPTEPIKLEIMKQYNASMKPNKELNRVKNKKILDNNNNKITKLIVNKENNAESYLSVILPKSILLNGFSLKTNISNFKVVFDNNGFTNGQHYNGGVNGVKSLNYYFDNPIKTKVIKIIPFINPKNISDKKYFISDVNIYKFSYKINEGFANSNQDNQEDNDALMNEVHDSINIQQACQALAYQEDINKESYKLQQFKKYNLKLQKQEQELEELNRTISQLKEKRKQQMEKEDILSVVKHQNLKGEEVKLIEKLKENKNKTIDLNLNF